MKFNEYGIVCFRSFQSNHNVLFVLNECSIYQSSKTISEEGSYTIQDIYIMGFPGGSDGKLSACNAGDPGSIPGSGRSPGEGNSYPLQHSGLQNSMDCIVQGVSKESDMTERSSLHLKVALHIILIIMR